MENLEELFELILHYLRGIWKNRWYAISIAWPLLLAGTFIVDRLEDKYTAETQVYIDTTSVLKPLLKGLAIQSDFQSNVRLMSRKLLSRPNLERAARQLDLDIEVNTSEEMETLINNLIDDTTLQSKGKSGAYTISYINEDPRLAKKMVQTLLDIFIEDTLGKNSKESDTAISFLDNQIKKYDLLLSEAETRLENFKRKNLGVMPKDGAGFYQDLKGTQIELERAKFQLSEFTQRRNQLKKQLVSIPDIELEEIPFLSRFQPRVDSVEAEIDDLLILYTDQHPDIISKKRILEALKKRVVDEKTAFDANQQKPSVLDNPVTQELQILLSEAEASISSLKARVKSYDRKENALKQRVDIIPKIEAELTRLNRDYSIHKANYTELVQRREQAKISEDVESGTEQVKFRIIEPPNVPSKPDFPNRPLFDMGVLVIAFIIGYGISLLISLTQPVFYTANDLKKSFNLPILGSINKLATTEIIKSRRKNLAFFIIANGLLVTCAVVIIYAHSKDFLLINALALVGIKL